MKHIVLLGAVYFIAIGVVKLIYVLAKLAKGEK